MKTTGFLLTTAILLSILTGALATVFVVVLMDNNDLREEVRAMRGELRETGSKLRAVTGESDAVKATLASRQDELQALETELKALKSADSKAETAAAEPSSMRVRAYLGQQYLGMGWMILNKLSKEPETGRTLYEPVVVLDETVKANAALYKTNVVEREVSRATTYNYYPQPYYYPVVFFTPPKKHGHTNPTPPPKMPSPNNPPPPGGGLFRSDKFFLPKEKPFLPPVDQRRVAPNSASSGFGTGNRPVQVQAAAAVASR